jgi:hypothetical protein
LSWRENYVSEEKSIILSYIVVVDERDVAVMDDNGIPCTTPLGSPGIVPESSSLG